MKLAINQVAGLIRAVAALVMLLAALPAAAYDHVLVMTISDYARSPLQGVTHDARNAIELARRLGYDTAQATILKDRQLTGAGMRQAFSSLLSRVQRNDRVFIYYSGHGYSIASGSTCVQGLVAQDETLITTAELSDRLEGVKSLVSDALVIFDACFSGGNRDLSVTRALGADTPEAGERLHAKVWTPRGGERCELPVNELAKSWQPVDEQQLTRSAVFPKNNFTFIAAATEREVALDDRERGGLATLGLLQCAIDGVPASGGVVTAHDLIACAQQDVTRNIQVINARLVRKEYRPHQLVVYGNGERILNVKGASGKPPATGPDRADIVLSAFQKFAANSNGNWALRVEPSATAVAMGQAVRLRYQTSQTGYVQVLYVASDRREITRVWPAEGQTRQLTGNEGQLPISLTVTAPAGDNTFLIVVSQTPLNLAAILQGGSAAASPRVMQQLGCELIRQRNIVVKEDSAAGGDCNPTSAVTGTAAPSVPGNVDGYTARVFTVRGT